MGGPEQRIAFEAEAGESTADLAIRYCETGAPDVLIETLRVTDRRNGTTEEDRLTAPTTVPHSRSAGPSTVTVERGTRITARVTTTDLPVGGELEGGIDLFLGPGVSRQVAFTCPFDIPTTVFDRVTVFRFPLPGGVLDYGDPDFTFFQLGFNQETATLDLADGEAVLIQTGFRYIFHEEPVSLAAAVFLEVQLGAP